jgi:hypothetical protein
MKNLIIKIDYELLFDRSESMIYDKNDKFWELLKKLAKDNPDTVIYATSYLQKEHTTPLLSI